MLQVYERVLGGGRGKGGKRGSMELWPGGGREVERGKGSGFQ